MNTADKCVGIIERIVEIANKGGVISFERDWGGHSLTISIGESHTHVGDGDSFNVLVNNLADTLNGGPGLSWCPSVPEQIKGEGESK